MKHILVLLFTASLAIGQETPRAPVSYVIIAHKGYDYTVRHGQVIMKVTYSESQTSTAKPGDALGKGLHRHSRDGSYPNGPDLSQVPEVGVRINQCLLSKKTDHDGDPVIAIQPTPDPCITQNGNTLHYEMSPNTATFTYVNFDIISEGMEK
jgi:hypothetical protein